MNLVRGLKRAAWALLGMFLILLSYIVLIIPLLIVVSVIFGIPIGFFWLLWNQGDSFLISIATFLDVARDIADLFITLFNVVMEIMPVFATLWNLLMEVLIIVLGSIIELACDYNPFTSGWGGFLIGDCDLLWDIIDTTEDVFGLFIDFIFFLMEVAGIFGKVFKPVICFTRPDGAGVDSIPTRTNPDCTNMCASFDPPRPSNCYSFNTALIWTIYNFPEFFVNSIDLIFFFIYSGLFAISFVSGATEITTLESLWEFFVLLDDSEGTVIWKVVLGSLINGILVFPDFAYCMVFTENIWPCVLGPACRSLLDWEIPVVELNLGEEICPTSSGCSCHRCYSIYWKIFAFNVPCTTYCWCGHGYDDSILNYLVGYWHGITW